MAPLGAVSHRFIFFKYIYIVSLAVKETPDEASTRKLVETGIEPGSNPSNAATIALFNSRGFK